MHGSLCIDSLQSIRASELLIKRMETETLDAHVEVYDWYLMSTLHFSLLFDFEWIPTWFSRSIVFLKILSKCRNLHEIYSHEIILEIYQPLFLSNHFHFWILAILGLLRRIWLVQSVNGLRPRFISYTLLKVSYEVFRLIN